MKVTIITESGYMESLLGLSLSYNQPIQKMEKVALNLAFQGNAHNKFLETISMILDINAPRFWWQEFDTYRVGMTKQSESTIHTLKKQKLSNNNFEYPISPYILNELQKMIDENQPLHIIKNSLPEGFLQRRIVSTNYLTMQRIIKQREGHALPQWEIFINSVMRQASYKKFLRLN